MRKRIWILVLVGLVLVAAPAVQAAWGPGDGGGLGRGLGLRSDNCRIIKGAIDRIGDDYVVIKVENIFVPREGPLADPPETVRLSLSEDVKLVTAEGRSSSLADFNKGDAVVAITTFEEGAYSLRALVSAQVAAAMRQKLGQRMRERMGDRRPGMPGRFGNEGRGRGMMAQRPAVLVGTFEGREKDAVRLTLTGFLKPGGADGLEVQPFPEEKTVTVHITERTRLFRGGERVSIRDFQPGEEIVALLPRRGAGASEDTSLLLLADRASAEKLGELLRGLRDHATDRQRLRDRSCNE